MASDGSTLLHYWIFFLTAILGIACILQAFTGKPLQAAKLVLFASPLLWLAPLIDLALSQGALYTSQSALYLFSPMLAIVFLQVALVYFSRAMDRLFNPRLRVQ